MKLSPEELDTLTEKMFERQIPMLSVWQTLADYFYPSCGGFTAIHKSTYIEDYLLNSRPVMARRDLADAVGAMLRDGEWFQITTETEPDLESERWLAWATDRMRKLMTFEGTGFERAMKEGDNFYVTFGQYVSSVQMNREASALLYRHWHLRDCAWFDDEGGMVAGVARKWQCTLRDMARLFGEDKIHEQIKSRLRQEPFDDAEVCHMVIPSDLYGDDELESKFPFVSIYIDKANNHILEEIGSHDMQYVVPRFSTVAGSSYGHSPAAVTALPDARMLQGISSTMLEAAERYARPTYLASEKAIRGDVNLEPDGVTWVKADWESNKTTDALQVIEQNHRGFPIGENQHRKTIDDINEAYHLPSLRLPDKQMTATEYIDWAKDFRRKNLPLFAPMEKEISAQICERTFELCMRNGLFGSPRDIPEALHGQDIVFKFLSPLKETDNERKVAEWQKALEVLAQTQQFYPDVWMNLDGDTGLRQAVRNTGVDPRVLVDEEGVVQKKMLAQAERQKQMQEAAEMAGAQGGGG